MHGVRTHTWDEAEPHLRGLRDTIPGDIEPLLRNEAGAPFAVCREVFSHVDYLGALHSGRSGVRDRFVTGLEDLQNTNLHESTSPVDLERFLLPESLRWWRKVDRFWSKGELITDD